MTTQFTALCIAVVLGTTALSTATFAQQSTTSRPTAIHRKTVTARPVAGQRALATRASVAATPSVRPSEKASPAAGAAQPVTSQPTTAPVHHTEQTAPVQAATPAAKYLNVGVGVAAYYGGGFPLGASLEVDVKENLSVGGSIDYMRYVGGYNLFYLGARGSYHFATLLDVQDARFDPYAGATLGYQHIGYNYAYEGRSGGLFLGIHVGARYYVNDKIGGFAEVGYGISALKLGVAAKF